MGWNSPITNVITIVKSSQLLFIFLAVIDQAVQRVPDLGHVGSLVVRIKVEEEGIQVSRCLLDEDNDAGGGIVDSPGLIGGCAIEPCRHGCDI